MTENTNNKNKSKHKTLDFHPLIPIGILVILSISSTLLTYNYNSWPLWGLVVSSVLLGILMYFVVKLLSKIAILLAFSANLKEFLFKLKQQICRVSLFSAITIWTIAAATAYTALNWRWGQNGPLSGWTLNGEQSGPLERIKSSLVIIGGIGGVGYLVIKYRQQSGAERDRARLEENEADKKLADAVQQLGSESPQVRIAGVYALADVADTYNEMYGVDYNKRVIEILCGYLRIKSTFYTHNENSLDVDRYNKISSATYSGTLDGPVETAILSILSQRLRTTSIRDGFMKYIGPGPWSNYALNLRGVVLTEPADFRGAYIANLDFQNAHFYNEVDFSEFHCLGDANFTGSYFERTTRFVYAKFHGKGSFEDVEFKNAVTYDDATFFGTSEFKDAKFRGEAHFRDVAFEKDAYFQNVIFEKRTDFRVAPSKLKKFHDDRRKQDATFMETANFKGAEFHGKTYYSGAKFEGEAIFEDATFEEKVDFQDTLFEHSARFGFSQRKLEQINSKQDIQPPTFAWEAHFQRVIFKSDAVFDSSKFSAGVDFTGAHFGDNSFIGVKFRDVYPNKIADFTDTFFESAVFFPTSTFDIEACFRKAKFFADAVFTVAEFEAGIEFDDALFNYTLKDSGRIKFPDRISISNTGLPEGAKWAHFKNGLPIPLENQSDETPPSESFPENGE